MSATNSDPTTGATTPAVAGEPVEKPRLARAIPGVVGVLDGGVPWIRTIEELDEEWLALEKAGFTLIVDGVLDVTNLRRSEKALLGMWTAARWTLGHDRMTPITRDQQVVTGAILAREIDKADDGAASRLEGWDYCVGVGFWLGWVTGIRDTLTWPGWDATHPAKAIYHQPGPPPPHRPRLSR